ncbi:MAG: hypothetical protein ACM3U1_03080 [Chloroflexota bacterium]
MIILLIILVRIAFISFVSGNVIKFIRIARAPQNLRWELYPIPGRAAGEPVSGKAARKVKELSTIVKEVFTLSSVREGNPKLWAPSLFMHWAIYLLIAIIAINVACALLGAADLAVPATSILTTIAAPAGIIGAGWILFLRAFYIPLKNYSNRGHYFFATHLFAVFLAIGIFMITTGLEPSWAGAPKFSERLYEFIGATLGLSTYSQSYKFPEAENVFYFAVAATALFFLYLPATHMTHFFAKYFTYHQIRWDDEPASGKIKKRIARQLGYTVDWAAPHIAPDGKETWLAIATKRESKEDNNL